MVSNKIVPSTRGDENSISWYLNTSQLRVRGYICIFPFIFSANEFECHLRIIPISCFSIYSLPSFFFARASRASHRMICIFGKKKKKREEKRETHRTRHIAAMSILQVRWEISRERCRDKSFLASIVRALDRATFS